MRARFAGALLACTLALSGCASIGRPAAPPPRRPAAPPPRRPAAPPPRRPAAPPPSRP